MDNNRSKKLAKNTAILTFGTICNKGIMFLMTPLFTKWLSQSDYGIFDLICTYVTLLIPFITLECGEAVFRQLLDANKENNKKQIISNAVAINIIGFVISIVVTAIISIISSEVYNVAIYFVILLLAEVINNLMIMILRGLKMLSIYTIASFINVIVMVVSVVILVKFINLGLIGIILAYAFGYIVSSIFMMIKSKVFKYISFKDINLKTTKDMLKYSIPMVPNSLSWWIVNASDRTIVSTVLGSSSNAILAVAHKIPNLCQTIFKVFHLSWQENATETMNDKDRDEYYSNIMNQMIKILNSICAVILSVNFLIFTFLFSKEYFLAYYQVPILTLSIVASMLAQFIGGIYIAKKDTKSNGKTTVIAAIINIMVNLALIKYIGIYASSISTLVAYIALFIIRYRDIRKTIKLRFKKEVYVAFVILAYIMIMSYINNLYINIINICVASIYFIIANKEIFSKIINRVKMKFQNDS